MHRAPAARMRKVVAGAGVVPPLPGASHHLRPANRVVAMQTMTEQQARDFLTTGTRTAKLATVREDGRPHVVPIWFVLDDDGTLVFNTGAGTAKGKALQRQPAVCLCVDDESPPFAFVMVEGTAETSEDPDATLDWATRIGARYMGPDKAEEFGRRNAVPGELLVRVTPTRIVAKDGIID